MTQLQATCIGLLEKWGSHKLIQKFKISPWLLMAPCHWQAAVAAVALAEAEGHLHSSPQCQHLHLHPNQPASHGSTASAHPDPDKHQFSSFSPPVFTTARNIKAHRRVWVLFQLRPEAIQAPNFESHAACRHDRFLRSDWASWPYPGDHRWLFSNVLH